MALDLSFTSLADIAQAGGGGRPVEIPLNDIIEDPDQPRRVFDDEALRELAASIAQLGVIQAISVRPKNAAGKHVIIFGARRYRASRLAGRDRIRAVVEAAETPDAYLQLVENLQRDDLKPLEIAAFVAGRLQAGDRTSVIAERLGKPKDWVSRYAAVPKMPEILRAKLATSPIRAVYELFQAWREYPDAIEHLARSQNAFTDAQARHIAQGLRRPISTPGTGPLTPPRGDAPTCQELPTAGAGGRPPKPSRTGQRGQLTVAEGGPRSHPLGGETSIAREVRHLEGQLQALGTPTSARWLAHYAHLSTRLEADLSEAHDVWMSRRAALLLIHAVLEES